jgi:beta-phosphoglucomutase-like phosphatase (HAD superfamily)
VQVFEDSPSGVRAGVAAGVRTVGVLTSQSERALLDAGASFGIVDFTAPALWEALGASPPLDGRG